MKFILKTFLLSLVLLFTACSSKKEVKINKEINSFSLNRNIVVASVPKTVKSPISINLGLGGYVSKHVGIHMGTSVRPDISNDDGVNLQKGISKYSISLRNLIKTEFKKQMENDEYYKNKFVPFGADYTIHLSVAKYEFDDSLFSAKSHVKIYLELRILNKNDDVIYTDIQVNSIDSNEVKYTQAEILRSHFILTKILNQSISNSVFKLIKHMKEN